MALQSSARSPDTARPITSADVRTLEQPGKLFDATVQLPESVREAIGYDGEATLSGADIAKNARKKVQRDTPWSRRMHFIGAAIAIGYDDRDTARALLAELPPPAKTELDGDEANDAPKRPETHSPEGLLANLKRLAEGRPATTWEGLSSMLRQEEASSWLVARVRHRHLANTGDAAAAAEALEQAESLATSWVQLQLTHTLTWAALVVIGFLLMISWPLLKRVVGRSRRLPRARDALTPFEPDSLQRVLAWWFLLHLMFGMVINLITVLAPHWFVVAIIVNSLISGVIAITLIQNMGRRSGDLAPLTLPLRLSIASTVGGRWALPLWALGGLAVCLFFTAAGFVLNHVLFGAPSTTQSMVTAMERLTSGFDIALATIAVCVVAPLVEEIVFRGYVYQTMRSRVGPLLGMIVSGLLFGFVHLDASNLLPLAALGAGLAFVFEWSGSLWVPVAIHGLFNLLTVLRTFTLAGL